MLETICTDLETSKKLKELGLLVDAESDFYWEQPSESSPFELMTDSLKVPFCYYGAYTLEQIMNLLPENILIKDERYRFVGTDKYKIYYEIIGFHAKRRIFEDKEKGVNLATTAAKLLIKLKERKII